MSTKSSFLDKLLGRPVVDVIQYASGQYGIRKFSGFMHLRTQFFDISDGKWRSPGTYLRDCQHEDLGLIQRRFANTGFDKGTPVNGIQTITQLELVEMNKLAITDEGMRDLLLQAKSFYILKTK